jgi:glycogen debranching enzyme
MERSAATAGFVASPSFDHYSAIWARDAAITCVGAARSDNSGLVDAIAATLRTLAARVSKKGQVPTAIWADRDHWDWGDGGSVDASAWFVIALADYLDATDDERLAAELWATANGALRWLSYQDANNFGLIDSPPAADWMDSSLSRSGKVLHNNVLYFWAAASAERIAARLGENAPLDSVDIQRRINTLFWPRVDRPLASLLSGEAKRLPHPTAEAAFSEAISEERRFYSAAVDYGRWVDLCDVLANLLAVVSGAAGRQESDLILDYLSDAAEPYPTRSWPQPIDPRSDRWGLFNGEADRLQDPRWRNPPGSYHNGGIWPYIGGFHVMALLAAQRREEAQELLGKLAEANQLATEGEWGFHEWIHPETGEPSGASDQTWNAGSFAMAFHAMDRAL